ncbi:terpenoid synthase [Scleroderma citrinum]
MPISAFDNFLLSIRQSSNWWSPDREKVLLDPFTYVTSNPGKDIRRTLIAAFNLWLNVPKAKLDVITQVVDMVHNASLLLDDIEDDSELRRGKPAAHKVYGIPQTINSATYAVWLAYQRLASIRVSDTERVGDKDSLPCNETLDQIFTEELLHFHRGQGLDMHWRDSLTCPTEEAYIDMARGKASSVLRLSVKLMMVFSTNNNVDLVHLIDLFGVYGQIRDDYMNLQSKEYTDTKGLADDISEGKFSFPIIHSIQENPDNTMILDILKQRPKTPTLKHQAITYLKDVTHSFDYTLRVMRSLELQIREELDKLGGNTVLEVLLDKLHQ